MQIRDGQGEIGSTRTRNEKVRCSTERSKKGIEKENSFINIHGRFNVSGLEIRERIDRCQTQSEPNQKRAVAERARIESQRRGGRSSDAQNEKQQGSVSDHI